MTKGLELLHFPLSKGHGTLVNLFSFSWNLQPGLIRIPTPDYLFDSWVKKERLNNFFHRKIRNNCILSLNENTVSLLSLLKCQ